MRQTTFLPSCSSWIISIHAPVKGATVLTLPYLYVKYYFNPRTREGCDFQKCFTRWIIIYFNPRTREGCDNNYFKPIDLIRYFNPRTREGCDNRKDGRKDKENIFQSTHPWRVRLSMPEPELAFSIFQSTHPWRVRHTIAEDIISDIRFQSTHPWRVRLEKPASNVFSNYFNPRTREGCDINLEPLVLTCPISIHAPVKGATRR